YSSSLPSHHQPSFPTRRSSDLTGNLPQADLILVTHAHTDHFDATALANLRQTSGIIVAPQAVYNSLSTALKTNTIVLTNGASTKDRKSTRLNSSHQIISYAVFC